MDCSSPTVLVIVDTSGTVRKRRVATLTRSAGYRWNKRGIADSVAISAIRVFTPDVDQLRLVRLFTRETLSDFGMESDEIVLVVNELAANAICHAKTDFTVSLSKFGDTVLVEVADSHPDMPAIFFAPSNSVSGRGLRMVDRVATAWGVLKRPDGGKIVSAEVRSR
jgi:anti-sigma regulatory factor (Ser/Thr protein kinase)